MAGAPKVLLLFLQWLSKQKPSVEIHVLDMAPGILRADFQSFSKHYYTFTKIDSQGGFATKVLKKSGLLGKGKDAKAELLHFLAQQDFDVLYANTIKTVPLSKAIKANNEKVKLVLHLHELPTVMKLLLPEFKNYLKHIDGYIAVSKIVKKKLLENYDVSPNNIQTVYEFSKSVPSSVPVKTKETFNVGASGFVDWRKGHDIFIQVARYVKKYEPEAAISFTWVGPLPKEIQIIIEADLEKLDLQEQVTFVGMQENPWPYYNAFDLFMLPSREDPFPLVCIEMAMLKKPILCFEGAVGTAEILENGGGRIIPYLDIESMAEAIITYYENRSLLEKDGEKVAQLFSGFTPENQCPKLFSVLEDVLKGHAT